MEGNKWQYMQGQSFYTSTARERAVFLCDDGSFTELISPAEKMVSPHLPVLGEAVEFDDGVVTGVGKIGGRTSFVISQEGKFIGGAVGEVGGAKIAGLFKIALNFYEKHNPKGNAPAIIFSFETGGVRLHEANAGLLAHAEVMELIQMCRGKIPVISLIGSKLGCFGGMGFVSVATDMVIMSELGRIGLTGPEVIEEVMGKNEFDSTDRALIYRTTGGKHKYIMGDCAYLVADEIGAFRNQLASVLKMPYNEITSKRVIGTKSLVQRQMANVNRFLQVKPKDSKDVWKHLGNDAEAVQDMEYDEFMSKVKRL